MPKTAADGNTIEKRNADLADFQRKLKEVQASQPHHITCEFLFDEAKRRKMWLFDPSVKRWFSPEEFYNLYKNYPKNDKIYQRVEIKNPVEGINAGHKQLESLHTRIEIFSKRVIEYYLEK